MTPSRPLSSLTEAEARECFRVAFNVNRPDVEIGVDFSEGSMVWLDVSDGIYALRVRQNGTMWANEEFAALALVRFLYSLGVAWEENK